MKNRSKNDAAGGGTRSTPPQEVIRDTPGLRATYANTVQVRAGREEVTFFFGLEAPHLSEPESLDARLLERITVSPATAKKLSLLLPRVVADHESTYGLLPPVHSTGTPPFSPGPSQEPAGMGDRLFQLVHGLETQVGLEQSFKVLPGTLLANRFLLGFKNDSVPGNGRERILDICRRIHMPADDLARFAEGLPEANIVLFGFEEGETSSVFKAYLEFGGRFEEACRRNPRNPEPFLLHLGFKWDAGGGTSHAVARYRCFPAFGVDEMRERLAEILPSQQHGVARELADGILDRAMRRVGDERFLYLEVDEEGNPRKSFDINVYRANMRMQELYPLLTRMCRHYDIPIPEMRRVYEPAKNLIFGHLSGGIDREGRDFLTWYFGVKGSTI